MVDPFSQGYFSEHVSFVFNKAQLFPLNALSALSENITGAGVYGLYYTKKLPYGMTYGAPLAAVLRDADTVSAPCALQVYESLRRGRCARVQRSSRINGSRYDASGSDLAKRDRQLSAQAQERAWIWDYDAEVEAMRALARLG